MRLDPETRYRSILPLLAGVLGAVYLFVFVPLDRQARSLDAPLEKELAALAVRAYDALACLDWARADFRIDDEGTPRFLEMNPLPTFHPDGSFGILAELEEPPLDALLAELIAAGLRRLGLA